MICPYRKQIKKSADVTSFETISEYYMECYGTECPYYVSEQHYSGGLEIQPYCNRANTEIFLATHPSYMRGGK